MRETFIFNTSILITGRAGFIGNLCEYFINKGYKVVCFDNVDTAYLHNLDDVISHKNFTSIEGNIRNTKDCNKAVKSVDNVLHDAALASVPRSIKDPITTNEINITGFLNMLTASRYVKVKRFYLCNEFIYLWRFRNFTENRECYRYREAIISLRNYKICK